MERQTTMTPEDAKAIRRGIEVAERQIAEINARLSELSKLVEQRAALQLYVAQAKRLLGESGPPASQIPASVSSAATILNTSAIDALNALTAIRNDLGHRLAGATNLGGLNFTQVAENVPIWRDAAMVLAKAQHPMTVPEIVEAMKATGKSLTAENATEVVRVALNRKPEIFENVSRGRYALKSWPSEWKTRDRDDAAPKRAVAPFDVDALRESVYASLREVGVVKAT